MKQETELLDLVIIGAAAAGCAAAVYAARRGLKFVVIARDIGGEVALSGEVENWPGTIHTTGFQLAQDFHKHAVSYGVTVEQGYEVKSIAQEKNIHIVQAEKTDGVKKEWRTKTVIIGSGIHPRMLGVPGEEKLKGRGVTYCTVCDGPLFKNKVTATIGAGNSAIESVLMMAGIAKQVYVLTKYPNDTANNGGFPRGERILIDKMKQLPNVEIIYTADTKEILGDTVVTGIEFEDLSGTASQGRSRIDVQGVMVHIGMIPNSTFAPVKKNPLGEIEIDLTCRTSIPGIFAAGDVTTAPKQIAIAAGEGVKSALAAIDYVNKWIE